MTIDKYRGREQAFVKHFVLRQYLQRLVYKIGMSGKGRKAINYVDGFSGPWESSDDEHTDTSPYIALQELTRARHGLEEQGRQVDIAGLFIEKNREAHERLRRLVERFPDVSGDVIHGEFEAQVPAVAKFCRRGTNPFAFVFIDPTGWTGFALNRIAPILRVRRSEALINFMTKDISRFVDKGPETARASFNELYGSDEYRAEWKDLEGLDRVDRIVETYCRRVHEVGGFRYCVSSVVLDPQYDRQHYHLIYATRNLEGLRTFRRVEDAAMKVQRDTRSDVRASKRVEHSSQFELFGQAVLDSRYVEELVERYRNRARKRVEALLQSHDSVGYKEVIEHALQFPMTSERTVKGWVKEWGAHNRIEVLGLRGRERVPKVEGNHRLRWIG